jgi:hypothetical protein
VNGSRKKYVPRETDARALLVVVSLVVAGLVALLYFIARSEDEVPLHPWWEFPSLGVMLVAPYLLAAYGLYLRDSHRAAAGLVLLVAGLASLAPAFLTLMELIGVGLFLLAIVLIVMGVRAAFFSAGVRVSPVALLASLGCLSLLWAAPVVHFVDKESRCERLTHYTDGQEVREVLPSGTRSLSLSPPSEEVATQRAGCTSDYTTAHEAFVSSLMTGAGFVVTCLLPLFARGRRTVLTAPAQEG